MDPILFRPDGPWTFYCVMACHFCSGCRSIVRFDQVCPCWQLPALYLHRSAPGPFTPAHPEREALPDVRRAAERSGSAAIGLAPPWHRRL
jgi:hypothetical protein